MIRAWLVIASDGFEALFKDQALAIRYAANCHGTVWPLVIQEAQ